MEETGHAPHLDHHLWSRSKRVDNLSLLYDDGLVAALRVLAVQHPELRRLRKVPYYVVSHVNLPHNPPHNKRIFDEEEERNKPARRASPAGPS